MSRNRTAWWGGCREIMDLKKEQSKGASFSDLASVPSYASLQ